MKLYLTRHGETDYNRNNIFMGRLDIPLNKTGRTQAKSLAEDFKTVPLDICYTSPLLRTKQTAEIICQNKIKILEDPLLQERHLGIYQGKSLNEVDLNTCTKHKSVESDRHLFNRAKKFADQLKTTKAKNILIVSHSGLLKNLIHIFHNGTFKTFDWQKQPNLAPGHVYWMDVESKSTPKNSNPSFSKTNAPVKNISPTTMVLSPPPGSSKPPRSNENLPKPPKIRYNKTIKEEK